MMNPEVVGLVVASAVVVINATSVMKMVTWPEIAIMLHLVVASAAVATNVTSVTRMATWLETAIMLDLVEVAVEIVVALNVANRVICLGIVPILMLSRVAVVVNVTSVAKMAISRETVAKEVVVKAAINPAAVLSVDNRVTFRAIVRTH